MRGFTWIFDLDNTLHDASPHIFPHLSRSMTAYLQAHLDLDREAAQALRVAYWKRYGATLLGLMRHHGTDPRHFLWHTHQFPELERMLRRAPNLHGVLRRLPGRKIVFSNAPAHYARAVVRLLDIGRYFDDVFSIEHTRFRPKPDVYGFRRLLDRYRLSPRRCIMVDDTPQNLRTAKRLGMRTVWVTRSRRLPRYVDVKIDSLPELPRRLHLLI
ncbi:pyrimidine 5'-nucleotidase [Pelomicrobium sp.]|uniref:pyrimidine 5'-nucleotidase n=1 Tax=Pelomicrobium sp. TaxID=2815319 RepID=UPI002FDD9E2C